MKKYNTLSWLVLVVVLVGLLIASVNAQSIRDWLALRNYQPSARVIKLADETTMTDETRKVFYVNHPDLNNKSVFNDNCRKDERTNEESIVLGCYVSNRGIFLLDVNDPRLNGVMEVTAAHELLHAEYDRLSSKERIKVDAMTNSFFAGLKNDRIRKTIENYRKKDPKIVPNELHSILGTEVADLSPDLEKYYQRYFTDRKQIVSFSEQYEQAFIDLRNQVGDLDKELTLIKQQIDTNDVILSTKSDEIARKRAELDQSLKQNDVDGYNAQVASFNQLVGDYNRLINTTKQLIISYNEKVATRNSIATQEQELIQAIDSKSITKEQPK